MRKFLYIFKQPMLIELDDSHKVCGNMVLKNFYSKKVISMVNIRI